MSSLKVKNQKQILAALSMDLLRVALGRHRGSHKMADRFTQEARARLLDLPQGKLTNMIDVSLNTNSDRQAEDLLMYSTIIKNKALAYDQD